MLSAYLLTVGSLPMFFNQRFSRCTRGSLGKYATRRDLCRRTGCSCAPARCSYLCNSDHWADGGSNRRSKFGFRRTKNLGKQRQQRTPLQTLLLKLEKNRIYKITLDQSFTKVRRFSFSQEKIIVKSNHHELS